MCFAKFNPDSLKQSWYEFDYYFINRQTSMMNKRLSCWNKMGVKCAERTKAQFPKRKNKARIEDIESKYKKMHADGERFRLKHEVQAAESHLSVLTLGLSEIDYGCAYQKYVENPIEEFADGILEIVQGICEGDEASKVAMAQQIDGAMGLFEALGITNIADGVGIDLSVSADAGAGVTSNLSIALSGRPPNSCYQFFCKTSLKGSATLGVSAAAKGRVYLGCQPGRFSLGGARLSLGGKVQFLLGANISYGLGIKPNGFLNRLQRFNEHDKRKFKEDLLGYVNKVKKDQNLSDTTKASFLIFAKIMGSGLVAQFSDEELQEIDSGLENNITFNEFINEITSRGEDQKTTSLGSFIKRDLGLIINYVEGETLRNILTAFHEGVTGCDIFEAGVSGGKSVGGGPVVAGSYSSLLGEVPMRELHYFMKSIALGKAYVGALACSDNSAFRKNMNTVINRFIDMKKNFRACYNDSVEQVALLGIRSVQIAKGEGFQFDPNTDTPYRRSFQKSHPHHEVCRCHPQDKMCRSRSK